MNRVYPPFIEDPPAIGLLVLRLVMGFALLLHGYPKLVQAFSWMGADSTVPGYLQALSTLAEFGGGLALLLGFLTPLACLGIIANMSGALFIVHFVQHDPFVAPPGVPSSSYELAMVYLASSFMFLLVGPGEHSVDAHLFRPKNRDRNVVPDRTLTWR